MTRPPRRPSALAGRSPAQPAALVTAVAPAQVVADAAPQAEDRSTKRIPSGKVQFTVYVPTDTRREARNAARHLGGRVPGLTNLSALVATAIDKEVAWLSKTYNESNPFPDSDAALPSGPSPD